MPGIGMGDKYSWTEPPTFNRTPGDYDYMSNASNYKPISLEKVEKEMNDIIDSINSSISNCMQNVFYSSELSNLNYFWNSLFLINGEQQIILKFESIAKMGDEIENGFKEVKSTVNSYFDDASNALESINKSLDLLEENAQKIANANINKESNDITLSSSAKTFLENVEKYGKQYTKSDLSSIGKWVY